MRTAYNKKLIQRISALNDIYELAEVRYVRSIELLKKWDRSAFDEPVKYMYNREELERNITRYQFVMSRIKRSYDNQVMNLVNRVA